MTTIVNNNDNNNNSKKTENQNIKTKVLQEPEDDFLDIITSIYKYHVSYPSLNIPMKINFNSSGRKLQPTLPRDKRCIFQFATRTKTDFKRIHSHTLVGSSFYLHSGLCDKSKLAILIEDYFSKIPQNNVNNHLESSTIDNTKLETTTNVNNNSNNKTMKYNRWLTRGIAVIQKTLIEHPIALCRIGDKCGISGDDALVSR